MLQCVVHMLIFPLIYVHDCCMCIVSLTTINICCTTPNDADTLCATCSHTASSLLLAHPDYQTMFASPPPFHVCWCIQLVATYACDKHIPSLRFTQAPIYMFVIAISMFAWRVGDAADVEVALGADTAGLMPVANAQYLLC